MTSKQFRSKNVVKNDKNMFTEALLSSISIIWAITQTQIWESPRPIVFPIFRQFYVINRYKWPRIFYKNIYMYYIESMTRITHRAKKKKKVFFHVDSHLKLIYIFWKKNVLGIHQIDNAFFDYCYLRPKKHFKEKKIFIKNLQFQKKIFWKKIWKKKFFNKNLKLKKYYWIQFLWRFFVRLVNFRPLEKKIHLNKNLYSWYKNFTFHFLVEFST